MTAVSAAVPWSRRTTQLNPTAHRVLKGAAGLLLPPGCLLLVPEGPLGLVLSVSEKAKEG